MWRCPRSNVVDCLFHGILYFLVSCSYVAGLRLVSSGPVLFDRGWSDYLLSFFIQITRSIMSEFSTPSWSMFRFTGRRSDSLLQHSGRSTDQSSSPLVIINPSQPSTQRRRLWSAVYRGSCSRQAQLLVWNAPSYRGPICIVSELLSNVSAPNIWVVRRDWLSELASQAMSQCRPRLAVSL